ncbi:MAG: hypothetical protein ACT4QE_19845 [Anaerolineales bacterium]
MRLSLLYTFVLALSAVACQPLEVPSSVPAQTEPVISTPIGLTAEPIATVSSQEIQVTPVATSPLPVDPGARELVEVARADLAAHLGLSPDNIGFVDFAGVVWPDGSLGCPQPDIAYPQVVVEGYLIRLVHGKVTYHYHGGEGRGPFLCENSQPPLGGNVSR